MRKNRRALLIMSAMMVLLIGLTVGFRWSVGAFGKDVPKILLPSGTPEGPSVAPADEEELLKAPVSALLPLELTPENVARAVETLARPEVYAMEADTSLYYEGGEGNSRVLCYTLNDYTKTELLNSAGSPQLHVITGKTKTFIWRAGETRYYTGEKGTITADDIQRIPTYEDVLALDPEQITDVGFERYGDKDCIAVSWLDEELGYTEHYWISVENGLLAGAEKTDSAGKTIYRCTISKLSYEVDSEVFRLPDRRTAQEAESELEH